MGRGPLIAFPVLALALAAWASLSAPVPAAAACSEPLLPEETRVLRDNRIFFLGEAPACPLGGYTRERYEALKSSSIEARRRRARLAGDALKHMTASREASDAYFQGPATPNKAAGRAYASAFWSAGDPAARETNRLLLGQCLAADPDLDPAPKPLPTYILDEGTGKPARAERDCNRWAVHLPQGPGRCRALGALVGGIDRASRLAHWGTIEALLEDGSAAFVIHGDGSELLVLSNEKQAACGRAKAAPSRAGGTGSSAASDKEVWHFLPQEPSGMREGWDRVLKACQGTAEPNPVHGFLFTSGESSRAACEQERKAWDAIKCARPPEEALEAARSSCHSVRSLLEAEQLNGWMVSCPTPAGQEAQPAEHYKVYECWAKDENLPLEARCYALAQAFQTQLNFAFIQDSQGRPADYRSAVGSVGVLARESGLLGRCPRLERRAIFPDADLMKLQRRQP